MSRGRSDYIRVIWRTTTATDPGHATEQHKTTKHATEQHKTTEHGVNIARRQKSMAPIWHDVIIARHRNSRGEKFHALK